MRARVREEDPSTLVVATGGPILDRLDEAATLTREISLALDNLAVQALDRGVRDVSIDGMRELVGKLRALRSLDLDVKVPLRVLEIVSSPVLPSAFLRGLDEEIARERRALDTKKRLFRDFLRHLDEGPAAGNT